VAASVTVTAIVAPGSIRAVSDVSRPLATRTPELTLSRKAPSVTVTV
jgi:hypothetical protein